MPWSDLCFGKIILAVVKRRLKRRTIEYRQNNEEVTTAVQVDGEDALTKGVGSVEGEEMMKELEDLATDWI